MTVSVIVPAWNGALLIANCLRSIVPQLGADDELIVVDNGSTDGTPDLIERDFPAVRIIRLDRNLGFAGGVNRGLEIAKGDILILINQDVVLRDGCLEAIRHRLARSGPAIVGCKLLYPDGKTIQHAGGMILQPRAEPDHRGYRQPDDGRWDTLEPVDYVTGAVFAFDRAVGRALGKWDEGFDPAYYEEVDYCYRARRAGFPVLYEPSAVAIHYETQSSETGSTTYFRAMQRGRMRFVLKHTAPESIVAEFLPAEREYVRRVPAQFAREVLAHAYFSALLKLPRETLNPGVPDAQWPDRMGDIFTGLSQLCLLALQSRSQPGDLMNEYPNPIQARPLREHDFRSGVPVVGRLIRFVRRSLYALTAKWGVRVVIDQQNEINRTIAKYLMECNRRLEELDARLIDQDRDLTQLARSIAEMNLKLNLILRSVEARADTASADEGVSTHREQ